MMIYVQNMKKTEARSMSIVGEQQVTASHSCTLATGVGVLDEAAAPSLN